MKLEFIFSSKVENSWSNVPEIFKKLKHLKKLDIEYKIIDTFKMTDEKIYDLYSKAYLPSVKKQYRIKHIFGSRNYSGTYFGKKQPALLVYENNKEIPIDIFPHEKEREKITIEQFLDEIKKI